MTITAESVTQVREDCTAIYGEVFGPCRYPSCACTMETIMRPQRPHVPDPEMQDKIRDKASRGDYD